MIIRDEIVAMVDRFLDEQGGDLYLVACAIHPSNRIVIELDSPSGVSIDACATLSKHIEGCLDREVEDFELEVGSSGLTSPLKILRQYQDTIGQEVEVLQKGGFKHKGTLLDATAEAISLQVSKKVKPEGAKRKILVEETLELPMTEVLQTKRIIEL